MGVRADGGVAALIFWLTAMSYHMTVIRSGAAGFQSAVTLAAYPFLTWLFAMIHRANLRRR